MVRLRTRFVGAIVLVGSLSFAASPVAATGWLDTPLVRWNGPHQGVPLPPAQTDSRTGRPLTVERDVQAMCLRQERAPVTEEEKQVVAAGWRLQGYWPTVQQADITVVTALSWYDGMCRPWAYQAFAFVGGRFAGTLSPVVMNSRLDGTLADTVTLQPGGVIEATFTRYADSDPLCCPSLPKVWVRYDLVAEAGGRFFTPTATRQLPVAVAAPTTPPPGIAPPSVPSRLPNTGESAGKSAGAGLAIGLLSVLAGLVVRRSARHGSVCRVSRPMGRSVSGKGERKR